MKPYLILLAALLSTGCNLVPIYHAPEISTPNWRGVEPSNEVMLPPNSEITTDLWSRFGNTELEALVREALNSNHDVRASVHRIEQARASARITASSLFPTLDATASAGRSFDNPGRGSNSSVNNYRTGLQAGYELDLFGRNRANVEASELDVEATIYLHDALALVTASDTARAFIGLLALDDRLQLAQESLTNAREVMRITSARFDAGTLSALELAQQRTELANNEASIASLMQQRETLRNQLAVLAGKPPQDFSVQSRGLSGFILPEISPLQPAELLTRRPDIRASETQLRAANYDIGAARAAFFPNFQLSASAVLGATPASAPASLTSALAAAVAAPIFSGGALEGSLDLATARRSEFEESYKKIVLTSFQEVQDALAAEKSARERVVHYTLAVQEAQKSYALVRQRFDAGIIDFITLLDTQRSLFNTQDALINARQEQFFALIDLYKALGGGWETPST